MDIDFIIKIAAVGIIVALLDQLLKSNGRGEMATLTTFAGFVIMFLMVMQEFGKLFASIKSIFGL